MMNTHHIDLVDYHARPQRNSILYLGTAGSHGNEQLQVQLGKGWEGLTVQVIFHPSEVAVRLPTNGLLEVPWEATEKPLKSIEGKIVFQGFDQERLVNSTDLTYIVTGHSSTVGRSEKDYTPGVVEKVLNQAAADKEKILNAAQQADQAKNAAQQAVEKVESAALKALDNIAAAAPALPAISPANAGQVVTVMSDGGGYQLAGPFIPVEAGIRPTVGGNPAVCKDSIECRVQGLRIYGGTRTEGGVPSPQNEVSIISAGTFGSIELNITDGVDQCQSIVFFTPSELIGIPVKSGGNYVDISGQHWICDIIDFEKKIKIESCGKRFFTGEESFKLGERDISTEQLGGVFYLADITISSKESSGALCNYSQFSDVNYNIRNDSGFFDILFQQFRFSAKGYDTVEDFQAFIRSLYEMGRPLTVLYPLENPSIIPLSDKEIEFYRNLTTYTGSTIVSTAEPVAGIEVRYLMDGMAIYRKLTELDGANNQ